MAAHGWVGVRVDDVAARTGQTANTARAALCAKSLISASAERVKFQEPLEPTYVDVNPATLVVGGGIAGLQAAVELADAGYPVYLVERQPSMAARGDAFLPLVQQLADAVAQGLATGAPALAYVDLLSAREQFPPALAAAFEQAGYALRQFSSTEQLAEASRLTRPVTSACAPASFQASKRGAASKA